MYCRARPPNVAWTVGSIYIGFTRNPERQYAILVALQTVAQSAFSFFLPQIFPVIGNAGIQLIYALPLSARRAARRLAITLFRTTEAYRHRPRRR